MNFRVHLLAFQPPASKAMRAREGARTSAILSRLRLSRNDLQLTRAHTQKNILQLRGRGLLLPKTRSSREAGKLLMIELDVVSGGNTSLAFNLGQNNFIGHCLFHPPSWLVVLFFGVKFKLLSRC